MEILSTVPKKTIDALAAEIPRGRIGTPEEVADLVLFLFSEKSSFITG